nr:MAG TPA: hypothetical protein [Caudoviricetes sp.]
MARNLKQTKPIGVQVLLLFDRFLTFQKSNSIAN